MEFLDTPEKKERRMVHIPMGRFGEAIEQARAALFREWRSASYGGFTDPGNHQLQVAKVVI